MLLPNPEIFPRRQVWDLRYKCKKCSSPLLWRLKMSLHNELSPNATIEEYTSATSKPPVIDAKVALF
jgi:hypothetical protein